MTLEEFSSLSYDDLKKLSTSDLKKLVSEKGKSLNKRIRRIKADTQASQVSVQGVEKTGGTFKVGGKSRKQLLAEAKREQRFAKGVASTVKKARSFKEKQFETVTGKSQKEYKESQQKEFLNKGKPRKFTKAEKEAARRYAERKLKELNDKIGDYWENFHKWQEENPTQGSPTNVKNNVEERAYKTEEEQRERFNKLVEREQGKERKKYESGEKADNGFMKGFQKVTEQTPFDLDSEVSQIEEIIKASGGIPLL